MLIVGVAGATSTFKSQRLNLRSLKNLVGLSAAHSISRIWKNEVNCKGLLNSWNENLQS